MFICCSTCKESFEGDRPPNGWKTDHSPTSDNIYTWQIKYYCDICRMITITTKSIDVLEREIISTKQVLEGLLARRNNGK